MINTNTITGSLSIIEPVIIETTDIQSKKSSKLDNFGNKIKPFKKGQSGNPAGKPVGTVQVKDRIRKKLNTIRADKVAEDIISKSEQGVHKSQEILLKLTGDLDETPKISIQNNTLNITDEILVLARQMIEEERKQINES